MVNAIAIFSIIYICLNYVGNVGMSETKGADQPSTTTKCGKCSLSKRQTKSGSCSPARAVPTIRAFTSYCARTTAYIGQAKQILSRLAQHLAGYERVDLSLKKRGLWREDNPGGWKVHYIETAADALDLWERRYIHTYANAGYQLYNETTGGQGKGKRGMKGNKPAKGYYDGLEQGRRKARQEIAELFEKHLDYKPKSEPPTRYQIKAMEKFKVILEEDRDVGKDE